MSSHETITRLTDEEIQRMLNRGESQTDWAKVAAISEEELEASIDHEEEGEIDWSTAQVGIPTGKQQLTVRFDLDVIEWFRAQGAGYQTKMNQVLRHYVDTQRRK